LPASLLYERAVATLGDARAVWDNLEARIGATNGTDTPNESGTEVAQIIRTENHLSSDPQNAAPEPMGELLRALCGTAWPAESGEFVRVYREAAKAYALRGRPVGCAPTLVYRYFNGPGLVKLGMMPALRKTPKGRTALKMLEDEVDSAEHADSDVAWAAVLTELKRPEAWRAIPTADVQLARPDSASMFVTFDGPADAARADRSSATKMHAALALGVPPRTDCFLEVSLPPSSEAPLRFPTLADAGWYAHFRSAPPDAPHGLTRPHDPRLPPQPEAVRPPGTLAELPSSENLRILPK